MKRFTGHFGQMPGRGDSGAFQDESEPSEDDYTDCPECQGIGDILQWTGEDLVAAEQCPKCDGYGYVLEETERGFYDD